MRSDLDANHDHLAVGQPLATIEREEPGALPPPPAVVPPRVADAPPVPEPTSGAITGAVNQGVGLTPLKRE